LDFLYLRALADLSDLEGAVVMDGAADLADFLDLEGAVVMEGDGVLSDLADRALASLDTLGFSALMLLSAATH